MRWNADKNEALKDERGVSFEAIVVAVEASGDLADIKTRALEEGIPYQTLIASVLHKYVTGRLAERPARR